MISSFVITGFLGAGKTTFMLKAVKEHFKDKKVAVIVNEIGDVGVDGKILQNVYSNVLELSEGCICCTLQAEFEKGVYEILEKYNPDFLFVETSGASNPFPIMLSLQNIGSLLEGVVCVVDAKNFHNYKSNETFKYQIGSSNIIVINKIDLVSEKELENIENEVKVIKKEYNLRDFLTSEEFFKDFKIYKSKYGQVDENLFKHVYPIRDLPNLPVNLAGVNHLEESHIGEFVVFLEKEIFYDELEQKLKNIPKNIYRIKGIVRLKDFQTPMVVNYVFGYTELSPIEKYDGKSFLVFIGENIKKENVFVL
ncbi:cobalamin synthesis protein P47K [Hydrogenobaculum sp. Y04AAS1]|uniref:GTP-binding protein n=1 Tax=Hydrogenobaculum sp. (strain Y04AAS1) TaxID=380749 RepID=UPI00015BCEA9|nr:cobalamin synthesis protein P47K [Hydrogenobaculum sp. Y04AAS1]HCT67186.1 GTP-binding protein [Hydrogenobaculum sp.]